MYFKTLAIFVATLCVVGARPKRGSHEPAPVHEHQDEHQDEHRHEHRSELRDANHASATSSQHFHLHNSGGQYGGEHGADNEKHTGHPKYEFEYKVEDPHTGDNKYQKESRDGDKVEGVYQLVEADGRLRTVKHHVDKHSGFKAQVIHSGHAQHFQTKSHR